MKHLKIYESFNSNIKVGNFVKITNISKLHRNNPPKYSNIIMFTVEKYYNELVNFLENNIGVVLNTSTYGNLDVTFQRVKIKYDISPTDNIRKFFQYDNNIFYIILDSDYIEEVAPDIKTLNTKITAKKYNL